MTKLERTQTTAYFAGEVGYGVVAEVLSDGYETGNRGAGSVPWRGGYG